MLDTKATQILWDYFHDHYDTDDCTNNYVLGALDCADAKGYVCERVARKLFSDHGSSMKEYSDAGNPPNNALTILEWLGY